MMDSGVQTDLDVPVDENAELFTKEFRDWFAEEAGSLRRDSKSIGLG